MAGGGHVSNEVHPLLRLKNLPSASLKQMIISTMCFAGVQFGWALQISLLTPFILELGLPQIWITLVWLCGPISGFVVQPTVGVYSDYATFTMGRRRPFIIIGAIFIVLALVLIPNAPDLGHLMGDTKHNNPGALVLAVLGFWILDLANNTLQGPCRALLADIARPEQQERGNAVFSVWLAVGNILGYMAGWAPWVDWMPFWTTSTCDEACGNLRCAFVIAIFFLLITVSITCFFTKEEPLQLPPGVDVSQYKRPPIFSKIFVLIRHMPKTLGRVCVVNFFSWFAWFAFLIYITTWVGTVVNDGDPQADHDSDSYKRYTEGVRMGSFGLAFYAGVSAITSPLVAWIAERFGNKVCWALGELALGALLLSTLFVTNTYGAVAVIGLMGFPWSVTMTVPFALTAQIAPSAERGLYMGALNIFIVLPQCLMASLGPILVTLFGDKDSIRGALVLGAIGAFVSLLFVPRLISSPGAAGKGDVERIEPATAPTDVSALEGDDAETDETTVLISPLRP
eukprot:ANDGO_08559.mRNA.1 Sucrose transport protein SUC2